MPKPKIALSQLPLINSKQHARAVELDELRTKKKLLEQEIDALSPQVLKDLDKGPLRFDDDSPYERLIKVESQSVSVSTELLLGAGVSPKIIKRCTVKKPYAYPRVIRKGEPVRAMDNGEVLRKKRR